MDKKKIVKKIINDAGGIAKTSEFVSAGLSNFDVARLCKGGYIERVHHGYYQLAEKGEIKDACNPSSGKYCLCRIGVVLLRI